MASDKFLLEQWFPNPRSRPKLRSRNPSERGRALPNSQETDRDGLHWRCDDTRTVRVVMSVSVIIVGRGEESLRATVLEEAASLRAGTGLFKQGS